MNNELFDYAPLERKVSFAERFQKGNREWLLTNVYVVSVFLLFATGIKVLFPTYEAFAAIMWVFGAVAVVFALYSYYDAGNTIKMRQFSWRNGLIFKESQKPDDRPGSPFHVGSNRGFMEQFFDGFGRFYEVGNFRYQIQRDKRYLKSFGYLRFKLLRKLPHIVLMKADKLGTFTQTVGGAPVGTDKTQRLSLEGNFDQYFALYVPKGYETDALYVFTPDLMQIFIDSVNAYDCEIIDDDLYLYSEKLMEFGKSDTFKEIGRLTQKLNEILYRRTRSYNDDEINDKSLDEVANAGQRLKGRRWIGAIIFLAIAVLMYIWQMF